MLNQEGSSDTGHYHFEIHSTVFYGPSPRLGKLVDHVACNYERLS
jgi:hypothetical protein